jgi:hypothetical protein
MKRLVLAIAMATFALVIPATSATAAQTDGAKAPSAPAAPAQASVTDRAALLSAPPVFADYLQCFNGHVFSDFTDPDGDEKNMRGYLAVWRASHGGWTTHDMGNSGGAGHGVFFWIKLADHGIDPGTVDWYAVSATDEAGDWSGWVMADRNCKVL